LCGANFITALILLFSTDKLINLSFSPIPEYSIISLNLFNLAFSDSPLAFCSSSFLASISFSFNSFSLSSTETVTLDSAVENHMAAHYYGLTESERAIVFALASRSLYIQVLVT